MRFSPKNPHPHRFSLLSGLLAAAMLPMTMAPSTATAGPERPPQCESVPKLTGKKTPPSLAERATFIGHRGYWTIVPKKAIIHLPAAQRSKILSAPKGKLISFPKFVSRNSSWLHTYPVSLSHARGLKKIEQFRLNSVTRTNKMVVTTYKKQPTSLNENAYPDSDEKLALSEK